MSEPNAELGNAARQYPTNVPLDLDGAIAVGLPSSIPYPFKELAGPYIPSQYAANFQAYLDYMGIVVPYQNYLGSNKGQNPPPNVLQGYATYSGVSFTFKITYTPGVWSPFL